ncbi:MAG: sigma-54 dependent transcriptional regulator [Gemmatimonadota bacterium]
MKVLVVDDDEGLRKSLALILREEGYEVRLASDGEEGFATAEEWRPEIILTDVRMPGGGGLAFLDRYRSENDEALVLVMTAYGGMDMAVDAMQRGAYDYISKPFSAEEVVLTLRKAREREALRREVVRLKEEVRVERRTGDLVVRSEAMVQVMRMAEKVAPHPTPVLLTGETGTGKERVARFIHQESGREGDLVAVNCGAIPESLMEAEFFGAEKGAFTGADRARIGLVESAHRGTLFLDEIGDLPLSLQVKLLRVLQEGEVRPLGGGGTRTVDVRVVAATNRDLEEDVAEGRFREDLYYRLAVVRLHLPSLRERQQEIPLLSRHFLEAHRERLGVEVEGVENEAAELLASYPWPGNIRELENVLERAAIMCEGKRVRVEDLPPTVRAPGGLAALPQVGADGDLSVKRRTAALERHLIQAALERTGGNRSRAAEFLELSGRALRYKIRDYGLD